VIKATLENRPYASPKDYINKVKPKKSAMISLIKGGAFDSMEDRKFLMAWYIWETCDKKQRITLQNMGGLIKYDLLPETEDDYITARRVYEFNRYLKSVCKFNSSHYHLDERAINFIIELGYEDLVVDNEYIDIKLWDKKYQMWMDLFRHWISENKEEILYDLNSKIFLEDWNKYASGTISAWEMEALCFYYHQHELAHLNNEKYGFVNYFSLPEVPIIERSFQKGGKTINMFKLSKICGTCIAKNKDKGTVTLLTPNGVVDVKFTKSYFSMFDKQISERQDDGTKKIKEKSWYNRGNMIVVQGIRSGDQFFAKNYKSTAGHTLYKILSIDDDGNIELTSDRYQGEIE